MGQLNSTPHRHRSQTLSRTEDEMLQQEAPRSRRVSELSEHSRAQATDRYFEGFRRALNRTRSEHDEHAHIIRAALKRLEQKLHLTVVLPSLG